MAEDHPPTSKKRAKHLGKADRVLWERVTQTIQPSRTRKKMATHPTAPRDDEPSGKTPDKKATAKKAAGAKSGIAKPNRSRISEPVSANSTAHLQPLDRRTRSRLARGTTGVDARLDLHGYRQSEAHSRLRAFLAEAQRRGHKIVLVITGKGARFAREADDFGDERGVLRRVVPQWLRGPEFRHIVLTVEEAHATHGGAGAFYVRLRRARR